MARQEQTDQSQSEELLPAEQAYGTCIEAMYTKGLDQRTRVLAAQGIIFFQLCHELGLLINHLEEVRNGRVRGDEG